MNMHLVFEDWHVSCRVALSAATYSHLCWTQEARRRRNLVISDFCWPLSSVDSQILFPSPSLPILIWSLSWPTSGNPNPPKPQWSIRVAFPPINFLLIWQSQRLLAPSETLWQMIIIILFNGYLDIFFYLLG